MCERRALETYAASRRNIGNCNGEGRRLCCMLRAGPAARRAQTPADVPPRGFRAASSLSSFSHVAERAWYVPRKRI
eukprot:CAMPEP_0197405112 /NCGR_PEP_ID=MMETSP1165-20131217/23905_1 /TAXON_ID=284809 /ORGANISM="Chrysocystis fragilis, Strain CCMP3189" /LENGTH=75 /DNA_ID=CAMNT_0042931419 /DNA_START=272 /DNA_END=499 /DNA_ORIENTATION=-